jgi:bifunctional enzyme CysN/CysC
VVRPHQDFRGFAGRIASGTLRPGEEVVALPSGQGSRIRSIETADGALAEAVAGESVVLTLEDELDVGRGDMLVRRRNLPTVDTRLDATLCWMSETALDASVPYLLMHTSRQVPAYVSEVVYRIDVDTLHREPAETLGLNEIGRVQLTTAQPLLFDPYERNRATGGFILVDPHSNATVAAGMIRGEVKTAEDLVRSARASSPQVVWDGWNVPREAREERNGHRAGILWFTGLSGSGKSTLARALERELFARGCQTVLLDGDQLRHGLCGDLGFSVEDRQENVRRAGEVARLFFESGHLVLCTFISPFREDRERSRRLVPDGRFVEIFVDCELEECRRRDPKGLYRRADRGEIRDFTGVSSPYEVPLRPEIVARTKSRSVEELVAHFLEELRARGFV